MILKHGFSKEASLFYFSRCLHACSAREKEKIGCMRRDPRPLKYIPSQCAQISRHCVRTNRGERERERDRMLAPVVVACCALCWPYHSRVFVPIYRLGENYGQDSNKKDTTLSRLCFYLPYTSAFRSATRMYIHIYIAKEGRSTPFSEQWTLVPFSFYIFVLSDHSPLALRTTDGRF